MMTNRAQTHESHSGSNETKIGSERSFGIVFAVVLALLGAWKFKTGHMDWGWAALGMSVVFVFLAFILPKALKIPNLIWFKFGLLLHNIISPLVLGMLFFLTVTPTAIIMRLLGKDLLSLRLEPKSKSYWIHRDPPGPEPKSMKQQF